MFQSNTLSRVATCENNNIVSGSYANNTLSLIKQGGGSVDIPFEGTSFHVIDLSTTASSSTIHMMDTILGENSYSVNMNIGTMSSSSTRQMFTTGDAIPPYIDYIGGDDSDFIFYKSSRTVHSINSGNTVGYRLNGNNSVPLKDKSIPIHGNILPNLPNGEYVVPVVCVFAMAYNSGLDRYVSQSMRTTSDTCSLSFIKSDSSITFQNDPTLDTNFYALNRFGSINMINDIEVNFLHLKYAT